MIWIPPPTQSSAEAFSRRMTSRQEYALRLAEDPAYKIISSTTSLLTAATLIYAIGAGITAAAGTRLSLQLILVKDFVLYSFQLPDL